MERTTEATLNSKVWVDSYGSITPVSEIDDDYLRNILNYLYKHRDYYWLGCHDVSLIEKYQDGDEFFRKVIRRSTLWKEIILRLREVPEGFNFDIEDGEPEWTR